MWQIGLYNLTRGYFSVWKTNQITNVILEKYKKFSIIHNYTLWSLYAIFHINLSNQKLKIFPFQFFLIGVYLESSPTRNICNAAGIFPQLGWFMQDSLQPDSLSIESGKEV